jgi:hypothetical protein
MEVSNDEIASPHKHPLKNKLFLVARNDGRNELFLSNGEIASSPRAFYKKIKSFTASRNDGKKGFSQ